MYSAAAAVSLPALASIVSGIQSRDASAIATRTTLAAGNNRRILRAQKASRVCASTHGRRRRWLVIKNPEMTKNTSTPTYPPDSLFGQKW